MVLDLGDLCANGLHQLIIADDCGGALHMDTFQNMPAAKPIWEHAVQNLAHQIWVVGAVVFVGGLDIIKYGHDLVEDII